MTGRGVVRSIDELGRVTLPKEFRKSIGIEERDPVEICMENGHLEIYPVNAAPATCSCCGATKQLRKYGNVTLCNKCLQVFFDKEVGEA